MMDLENHFFVFFLGGCGAGKKVDKATRLFLGTYTIMNNHYKTSLIELNSSRRQENERERERNRYSYHKPKFYSV